MSITKWNDSAELLRIALRAIDRGFMGIRVAELGNQRVKGWDGNCTSRNVFGVCGADRYVCIDWNGRDGAVKQDLGAPLTDEAIEAIGEFNFDVVTNFGTSEHVQTGDYPQYSCFRTVHRLCRVGGAMVHYVPMAGTCKGHGTFKYSRDFFRTLASMNNYDVVMLEDRYKLSRKLNRQKSHQDSAFDDRYMCAVLVKTIDEWHRGGWVDPERG